MKCMQGIWRAGVMVFRAYRVVLVFAGDNACGAALWHDGGVLGPCGWHPFGLQMLTTVAVPIGASPAVYGIMMGCILIVLAMAFYLTGQMLGGTSTLA